MLSNFLLVSEEILYPFISRINDNTNFATTRTGRPKQQARPDFLIGLGMDHWDGACNVGNVNLGYAYELGFKFILEIEQGDFPQDKDGHNLLLLYDSISQTRQHEIETYFRNLDSRIWDHAIRYGVDLPKSKKSQKDNPQSQTKFRDSLVLCKRQKSLLDSRYKNIGVEAQRYMSIFVPHRLLKTMRLILHKTILPLFKEKYPISDPEI